MRTLAVLLFLLFGAVLVDGAEALQEDAEPRRSPRVNFTTRSSAKPPPVEETILLDEVETSAEQPLPELEPEPDPVFPPMPELPPVPEQPLVPEQPPTPAAPVESALQETPQTVPPPAAYTTVPAAQETAPLPPAVPAPEADVPVSEPVADPLPSASPVPAEAEVSETEPQEKVWLDGRLPEEAEAGGAWIWSTDPSSGAAQVHSHPAAKGAQSHGFSGPPVELPGDSMLVQQVWLDPQNPPEGIALRFKLASGEEVGVYWEGEREVFTPTEYEELWYYGMLPELGKWVSLEVLNEDLGLEDSPIMGVAFSTFSGRALWGKTSIVQAPPLEGDSREAATDPIPSLIPDR